MLHRGPHPRRLPIATLLLGGAWMAAAPVAAAGGLDDLVDGPPTVREVAGGFAFTEGPATDARGDVYFSDIPKKKIHVWRLGSGSGEVETWIEDSGSTNGLFFGPDGVLYACQMGASRRVVAIDPETREIRPLTERYEGKRFNAPNDLVVAADGGIWFTDPGYGRKPEEVEQDSEAIYWISPDRSEVRRVADGFKRPNGIIPSPDRTTLYITDRDADVTWAYPVMGPGKLGERRRFVDAGCDGFAVDERGNLYATVKEPVLRVFAPDGTVVGDIPLPVPAANATFGGPDRKTLVITARDRVFSLPMKVRGG
jgi:gluconolactonase